MSTLSLSLPQQDNLYQMISSGSIEGNFLVWENNICIFDDIKKILIRESYETIYQQIIEQSRLGFRNFLITGVPGIGKSTFSYYFLWKYFSDNPLGEILLEVSNNVIYYIQPNKTTTLLRIQCMTIKCPYLVDLRDRQEPAAKLGLYTVVFSSPNPSRYKQFMKQYEISRRYIMPTWSYEESQTLNEIRNIPEEELYARFELVGGVPRLIFSLDLQQLSDMISKTLNEKGSLIANKFFTSGYQMSDDEISYLIIHLHPPINGYCSISDNYKFASAYIWENFYEKYKQIILSQSANYFNGGPGAYRGSFDGFHFEAVCLTAIPLAEHIHEVTSLNNSGLIKELSIPPSRKVNFRDDQTVESDVLYIPTSKNFESGDAFYLSNNELFVLQITIAETHPVKANGLQKIFDFFRNGGISNFTCHLVFVVPKDGKLVNKQNITTKEGKIAKHMSSAVVEFDEHQWRLEYIINVPNTQSYEEKTSYK